MKALFVADGHFKGPKDPAQAAFGRFLDSVKADRLFVLGDLFDFWTGSNRVVEENYRGVLEALMRLVKRGVAITYFEGNHDFNMGPTFTGRLGATVHAGISKVELDGSPVVMGHGDTVEMSAGYRLWRAYLRSPVFKAMAAAAGPRAVWSIAEGLSGRSRKRTYESKGNPTEDRLRGFAAGEIGRGAAAVVLGHSHAAGVTRLEADGRSGVYANPGSWARERSYLVYDGGFSLKRWKG